jgi:hypothetical protein
LSPIEQRINALADEYVAAFFRDAHGLQGFAPAHPLAAGGEALGFSSPSLL